MDLGTLTFTLRPWFAHGYTIAELKIITQPLLDKWAALGVVAEPAYYQFDTYLEARNTAFLDEPVAYNNTKIGGRLVPR